MARAKVFASIAITIAIVLLISWASRSGTSGECRALVWGASKAFMSAHHRWPTSQQELAPYCYDSGFALDKVDPLFRMLDARHAYMEVNEPTIIGNTRVRVQLLVGPNGEWLLQR